MESGELIRALPDFVGSYLDGAEPRWVVPPVEGLNAGSFCFRTAAFPDALVAFKILGNETDEVRITVGVAIAVPYSTTLAEYVNYLNNKMLIFGRMFIAGDVPFIGENGAGPCVIVMQEILFGPAMSFEFPPSMQHVLNLTSRLAAQASRYGADLIERFGGRRVSDDEDMVLTFY